MVTINASEFKVRCLAILDEVADTGEAVVILKRGRPVAQLGPPPPSESRYPQDELRDSVSVKGDVVGPVLPEEEWEAFGGPAA